MPSLRSDRTGQMSIIELLKLIYQIYSITKTPLKKFAKWLKTNFVVIPLWTGKIEYLYHIHEDEKDESKDERKKMYDYLKDADALKDFGFVFGNELNYNGARDIGVYGFLPFFEINHYYGNARIPKKKIEEICILLKGGVEPSHFRGGTIADICNVFEKNIYPENPSKKNIYCAIAAAKLLLKFVFEECTKKSSKDFKRMLSNPEGVFAHVYERLYESAPNVGEMRNKWMSRFLKASLRGMYASSEGLVVYRFTTKPLEAAAQVKDIAERMDGDASRAVYELTNKNFN
ncbi:TPA: hypothetical protein H1005_00445, partial [archaeon]|nr:hypothetical protein [Candidatus Naiadarchaeales archaeon SRR2090153.bin1042]